MNEAPPIIFLRGLLREQGHWGEFKQQVINAFPERECLFLDIAGNGDRFQECSANSIEGLQKQVAEQFKQISNAAKIDIVAISMGGMISLQWAKIEPNRINSLVLLNTSLKNFSPFYHRIQLKNIFKLCLLPFICVKQRESIIFDLTSNLLQQVVDKKLLFIKKLDVVKHWQKLAIKHPVSLQNTYRQLMAAGRFSMAEKPLVPTTLIVSEKDNLVSSKCSYRIAKAWQLPLIKHPWAGHDIALDDPKWLINELSKLLT